MSASFLTEYVADRLEAIYIHIQEQDAKNLSRYTGTNASRIRIKQAIEMITADKVRQIIGLCQLPNVFLLFDPPRSEVGTTSVRITLDNLGNCALR